MTLLLVGFDSAWTLHNAGAIVAVLRHDDGRCDELGAARRVSFPEATEQVHAWQSEHAPDVALVLLDQPTIVPNATGPRPVENLVGAPISRRYGGVQPASTSRVEMFGREAPVWPFLTRFGGAAEPRTPNADTQVFETYPVLSLAALGWIRADDRRATGRLPKYNPARRKTFSHDDWTFVCERLGSAFHERGLDRTVEWNEIAAAKALPRKFDQDGLDACLCLFVALFLAERRDCLLVGQVDSGFMVVPYSAALHAELDARCRATNREPADWVSRFRL